ncbi:MAG: methionyl-tRNA formyltransferase [Candidatus Roizmanbacteria bacterium]|nr:MAG: methionyl-tRNA formyltransferase [Candidatus Roizmanbacteria bacterium]
MKILFIGWGDNGYKCLKELLNNRFKIVSVIVPKNYDVKGIQQLCNRRNIDLEVYQSSQVLFTKMKLIKPDLMIVASFPKIFPKNIIFYPQFGSINVHAGELPKYRGYHPLNWAIIRDEKQIGVTVHYLDEGMDSGDILLQKTIPLSNYDDINTVKKALVKLGAQLLVQVVKKISKVKKRLKGKKQNENNATYAPKRNKEDGKIIWENNAREIFNLVRALKSPYPNTFAFNRKKERVEFQESYLSNKVGEVLAKVKGYYLISVGDGVILLKTKKKLSIEEILF